MRTLLIESSAGAGSAAEAALTDAGHDVVRCSEANGHAFPCADIVQPGSCPLTGDAAADVVLVARAPSDVAPTLAEAGVTCAIRAGVPVAVLGEIGGNPFAGWSSPVSGADPVIACERALWIAREETATPLRDEVVRMLRGAGATLADDDVQVEIEHLPASMHILVTVPPGMPVGDETIATHVHSAFRDNQRTPPRILDIAVRSTP